MPFIWCMFINQKLWIIIIFLILIINFDCLSYTRVMMRISKWYSKRNTTSHQLSDEMKCYQSFYSGWIVTCTAWTLSATTTFRISSCMCCRVCGMMPRFIPLFVYLKYVLWTWYLWTCWKRELMEWTNVYKNIKALQNKLTF